MAALITLLLVLLLVIMPVAFISGSLVREAPISTRASSPGS